MDREALEHSLVRRLLDHIEHHTTDMAEDVYEVPADAYTSRAHFEEELEALFLGAPLVLCLSGSLPRPGTFRTVDLCGTPVLVTRDADGRVRAMANVCRHRGVRVADGGGQTRRLTCPFHAWVYDLEGKLVGVPTAEGFEGMCREDKGLVQPRGRREVRTGRRAAPPGPSDRRRRVPRARAGRRAGGARLRRLGALQRAAHPPGAGQLEGDARHLPGELPLRPSPPEHARASTPTAGC